MQIRNPTPDEAPVLCDLLARSFHKPGNSFEELRERFQRTLEVSFNPSLDRVIEMEGRLVARVGILDRRMHYEGATLRVGAICGVCTDPAFRGRGLLRRLLEDATGFLRERAFDVSLLFGEPAYYGGSGWRTLSAFNLSTSFPLREGPIPRVRAFGPQRDGAFLARIHRQLSARLTGPFLRSDADWRAWVPLRLERGLHRIHVVEDGDAPAGYFVLRQDGPVCELGWDPQRPGALGTLVRGIFAAVPARPLTFTFFLPELFDLLSDLSQAPSFDAMRSGAFALQKGAQYCGLFHLLSEKPGEPTTEAFNERLRRDGYVFWDLDHF